MLLPIIDDVSLLFGPAEWFAFVVLGLVILAFSNEGSLKSLISVGLGLLLSVIGLSIITGFPRYTFGYTEMGWHSNYSCFCRALSNDRSDFNDKWL